ncbi:zinc finger protein 554-like [Ornithodoros turicata]|uniref:zinc finger protein 554-like n=1 Tax=Ornithodoros turicata TaxID=34597 RepID=UPI0031390F45
MFALLSSAEVRPYLQHKRAHTGEKPHKCNVCSAEFGRSDSLLDHKRTHTGEKPYKCDACPAEFSERQSLQQHKRGTHRREAIQVRKFSQSRHRQSHRQTYSKPYRSIPCSAKFEVLPNLEHYKWTYVVVKPYKMQLVLCRDQSRDQQRQPDDRIAAG